ncbi:MAG: ABC transporter permease [Siphonobacter aquaeclarae]|nr:ABC transporter permease [Siphonobacter aquaeclarae]
MVSFLTHFTAEIRKLKGTRVIWLAAIAPFFVVITAWLAAFLNGDRMYVRGVNPWIDFTGHVLIGWTLFVFPIYVSLLSALFHSIEHRADMWKMVYSLPIPRVVVYFVKFLLFTAIVFFSHILLWGMAESGGWLLGIVRPSLDFQYYSLHRVLFEGCSGCFLAGLGVVAIQFFLGFRYSSFLVPAGMGLLITMTGAISRSWPVSQASPYLWAVLFFNSSIDVHNWQYIFILLGIATYCLVGLAGKYSAPDRI